MTQIYLAKCETENEHDLARALAKYAIYAAFHKKAAIAYHPNGKPYPKLEGAFISISHSSGLCAAAVSDENIGIDIEKPKNPDSFDSDRLLKLAARYYTNEEFEFVNASRSSELSERFYRIWCAKESYAKFTGDGLAGIMKRFSTFDLGMKFSHFSYGGFYGCLCSQSFIDISPIEVKESDILEFLD